jgi:preprotein translocase subunit SecE
MATEEDLKKADEAAEDEESSEAEAAPLAERESAAPEAADEAESHDSMDEPAGAAVVLGYRRYVYAAYMAAALISAFLAAKIGHAAWYRLGQWKPVLGEPQDEILFPIAGVIGVAIAVYYWKKQEARQYVDEVAIELSKVTWPSREEVTRSTTVVVFTTIFATVFFALMDRFWGYLTDKILSGS